MPTDREALYGIRRPKSEVSKKDLTSSTTLAFATHLSSLISKGSKSSPSPSSNDDPLTSSTTRGRIRPSKTKKDLFSVHNKGAQKRAAADLAADTSRGGIFQTHKKEADIGAVDDAALHRSKRKMLEKAKLYSDLKRGEYLADAGSSDDDEEQYSSRNTKSDKYSAVRRAEKHSLVDFDRKWAAEEQERELKDVQSDDDGNKSDDNASLVDYEDEFGRARQGTRVEAAEAQRLREEDQQQQQHGEEDSGFGLPSHVPQAALPSRPSNLIYGSTIQAAAFNPDANIAEQMSHLSKRRDRTPTPPPETHYNADGEIRTRGTGFYAFSKDEEVRRGEMGDLLKARDETVREREEASTRKEARERAKRERKKKIEELRGKRRAEQFLNGLGGSLDVNVMGGGAAASEKAGETNNDGHDGEER